MKTNVWRGISIYIPTYHRGDKLRRCLSSVCTELNANKNENIEVHISSNDATDKYTSDIVNTIADNNPLVYFHGNNIN